MYHTIKNFKERYNLKYPYIFNPFSKRFQNKKNTLKTGFHYIFTPQLIKTALIWLYLKRITQNKPFKPPKSKKRL